MLAPHMAVPITRPFATPTVEPCLSYAFMTSITPLGPTVLNAREANRRSWQAKRRYARIFAQPPAVGSPRPPLQRLLRRLRFARHCLHARPA